MRFVLFPMLHLGAPSFYEDVSRRLRDDLPSRADVEMASDEHVTPFRQLLLADRDAHLKAALERIHHEHRNEAIQVAVIYGAGHMPAVVHHLRQRFDWARDTEWMTVFDR